MKVIALGGAGEMGRWAAATLLQDERVRELVIADLNGGAAARLASELGPRASFATVNVEDESALRRLFSGAAVVMNTVGPFFRFGLPVLEAAISARCHYVDICDDWEPTLKMLSLSLSARQAGVTAVVGMGASPGLSNLAAVKACRTLDSVHRVYTAWSLDGAAVGVSPADINAVPRRGPSAATVHGVHQMSGRIRARVAGRDADVRPLQRLEIDYPGLGVRSAWTIGHPEAVTLPRYLGAGVHDCVNVMFADRSSIVALKTLMLAVDHGWLSVQRCASWLERLTALSPPDLPQPWAAMTQPCLDGLPPLFALALGQRAGEPASAAVAFASGPAGGMGAVTGIPLALGVSWLIDEHVGGRLTQHAGVYSPEEIIEPDRLFEKLLPYCVPRPASVDDLALLTTSWQPESLRDSISRVRRSSRPTA